MNPLPHGGPPQGVNCPNCLKIHTGGPKSPGAGRRSPLVKLSHVPCATGDCDKYGCPACKAIFFFSADLVAAAELPRLTRPPNGRRADPFDIRHHLMKVHRASVPQ